MDGIFVEFENQNKLRAYPFAAGCIPSDIDNSEVPQDVFVDAVLYPVNPSGTLYLSGISADGVFSVSDDSGVIMTGSASGSTVEFFDQTDFKRHVGTLMAASDAVLANFANRNVSRTYNKENTEFASNCVFPVAIDGVTSILVGESKMVSGIVGFDNGKDDEVRVSSRQREDGRQTLRFDILPRIGTALPSIRRIICVVDGKTPFRIYRNPEVSYNTVILQLDGIDKESVCAASHRENDFEMVDACECTKRVTEKVELPEAYQIEEVFIPPDESGEERGIEQGADNAFYLIVPNELSYANPISITLEDGGAIPQVEAPNIVIDGDTADLAENENRDAMMPNSVIIQVPGLGGGIA